MSHQSISSLGKITPVMRYLYVSLVCFEVAIVAAMYYCPHWGWGSADNVCFAGPFSGMLSSAIDLLVLGTWFFGISIFIVPIIAIVAARTIGEQQQLYKTEFQTGEHPGLFRTYSYLRWPLAFLVFQIPIVFFGFLRLWYEVPLVSQIDQSTNDKAGVYDSSRAKPESSMEAVGQTEARGVIKPQSDPSLPISNFAEQGSGDWINRVEDRLSEYDLVNNTLVLNDVVERFYEKYQRLPNDPNDFSNFIPGLKPRYNNEEDQKNDRGWIYQILYQKQSDRQYNLCVSATAIVEDIDGFGSWQPTGPNQCIGRSIK